MGPDQITDAFSGWRGIRRVPRRTSALVCRRADVDAISIRVQPPADLVCQHRSIHPVERLRDCHDPEPVDLVKVFGVLVAPDHVSNAARRACGLANPDHVGVCFNGQNLIERRREKQ